jgi:3,4-dihydroxy 2-butanone 4-phosphate synthase/GTP cyclohydrolase II
MKEYGVGAQILKSLGVSHMSLLTTAKKTDFVGLSGFGLDVVEVINPSN